MGNGVVDQTFQRWDAALIGERPHDDTFFQAVADLDRLRGFHETFKEAIRHTVLYEEAGGSDADLTGIAELGKRGHLDRFFDIGIVKDHHWRMTTEFHRGALHVLAGKGCQMFADRRGAGEGNLADDRMRDQIFRNLGWHAVNETDDTCRHARIHKRSDQFRRRCRCFFRDLDDDGAARGKGSRQLADDLVDREVPWRKRRDGTNRQLDGKLGNASCACRDDLAVGATCFFGEPVDRIGGAHDLGCRLRQRLALLAGHYIGDLVLALTQYVGCPAHDLGTLERRGVAPDLEATLGGGKCQIEVRLFRMGDRADDFVGRRVGYGDRLAGNGVSPFAINEKFDVGIGVHRDYLHDAADTAGCRPARRREQSFPDRTMSGIAAFAARNGRLGISGKRELKRRKWK